MTIEHPMFPPRADECQVIRFRAPSSGGWKARARVKRAERQGRAREAEQDPNMKESTRNHRFRQARRDAWRDAESLARFNHARMEWHSALRFAQSWNVPGADKYPKIEPEDGRFDMVREWRIALVAQLLTPAPDQAAVIWKRAQLRMGEHKHIGVKDAKIQHAIDKDVAWLAAHPSKKSRPMSDEAKQKRREFKEAMRRRIKEIAASRDISDDEIRPVLSLRHHLIADFAENYGVNFEWLLEGKGRIFKKDPITLNPNMTGSEFAAVVTTLPMADQQAIGALLRDLVQERDQ
jgi:hypothetical protein